MKKVLVVDDQRMSRENMEHTIAEMGGRIHPFQVGFFGGACLFRLYAEAHRPCADGCLHKRKYGRH